MSEMTIFRPLFALVLTTKLSSREKLYTKKRDEQTGVS